MDPLSSAPPPWCLRREQAPARGRPWRRGGGGAPPRARPALASSVPNRRPPRPPLPAPPLTPPWQGEVFGVSWMALIEKAKNLLKRNKELQQKFLLCSQILYLIMAAVSSRFFFGLHGTDMSHPLKLQICTMLTIGLLLLSIVLVAIQVYAHGIRGQALLPERPRNKVAFLIVQMVLMLPLQAASCATSTFQALISANLQKIKSQSDFAEQLLIFAWLASGTSTLYSLVAFLTLMVCQRELDLEAGNNSAQENDYSSRSTLIPRIFQCLFAFSGALTMALFGKHLLNFSN